MLRNVFLSHISRHGLGDRCWCILPQNPTDVVLFILQNHDVGVIKMSNCGPSKIVRLGNISIDTTLRCTLILKGKRYILDLRLNLISARRSDEEGYINNFGKGQWKITKGSFIIARGKKCCTLYKMQVKLRPGEVNIAGQDTSTEL